MKLRKLSHTSGNIKYTISYEIGRITLDFESTVRIPSPYLQGRSREEFGFLEFKSSTSDDFLCRFLLCPMNMYEDGDDEFNLRLSIIEGLQVNGFEISALSDNVNYQSSIALEPEDVGEEGWLFSFSEAEVIGIRDQRHPISSRKILQDITLAESVEIAVSRFVSGRSGYRFFSFKIENLDEWRKAFVSAFGKEILVSMAASRGLSIEE
jgi:hypothetical protein